MMRKRKRYWGIHSQTPVQYLKGVGPKVSEQLKKVSIHHVRDLLYWFPRAYEDCRAAREICSLQPGEVVHLVATFLEYRSFPMGRGGRQIHQARIKDASGSIICRYFRLPYREYFTRFQPYDQVRVSGKVVPYRNQVEFHHPEMHHFDPDKPLEDGLIPLYTEIGSLRSKRIHRMIGQAIEALVDAPKKSESSHHPTHHKGNQRQEDKDLKKSYDYERNKKSPQSIQKRGQEFPTKSPPTREGQDLDPAVDEWETLPNWLLKKYDLLPHGEALKKIHQPPVESSEMYLNGRAPAQKRIIFEEFFWLELHMAMKKSAVQREAAMAMKRESSRVHQLINLLPFPLTGAQRRVFQEIKEDLQKPHPMHRMIQGDVGSGKTIVAWLSIVHGVDNGFQAALMAPTEILAGQHYKNATRLLKPLGIVVGLLSGKMKTAERSQVLRDILTGHIHLCVGTHALIQEGVKFQNLGLVIIDEQHRFGVAQRNRLRSKGKHFLLMTATPIPRSLAMTIYGDLDASLIDELPAGRTPVVTRMVEATKREKVKSFMVEQVKKGRQVYIVYPLVEESEKIDLKNAISEFEKWQSQLEDLRVGLLHGRMSSVEKNEVMNLFHRQQIDILVSTTVIEVGVDVPNANLMIIENTERFGLSQLHQLRGRVGRGKHKGYCILMSNPSASEEAQRRGEIMMATTDGFKIAEADLKMRGPGEFLGTRQSGALSFQMANLSRDQLILQAARQAAFEMLEQDPNLSLPMHQRVNEEFNRRTSQWEGLGVLSP